MSVGGKERSGRRTKGQLKKDIAKAMGRLVIERGFLNIPMLVLVKEAGVDMNVFYRNYGTIEKLYEEFVADYDFWLSDTLNISDIRELGGKGFYADALKTLYTELGQNRIMQRLLIWELEEDSPVTQRTASIRETLNLNLVAYYKEIFAPHGIDISTVTALFMAGVYFLVLHGSRSAFCTVNFGTDEGQKRLFAVIDMFVDLLFEKLERQKQQSDMIRKMRNDGIPLSKIAGYLGITQTQLKKILPKDLKAVKDKKI